MSDFMDTAAVTMQPTPEGHEKAVFVLVVGEDDEARFALTEEQAQGMQDQLADATGGFEVTP